MKSVFLAVDGNRGIYVPQQFCKVFGDNLKPAEGDPWEQQDIQATVARLEGGGPDEESYWDDWDDIVRDCILTVEGDDYFLSEDAGDVWAIPVGWEWDDVKGWRKATEETGWPEEPDPDNHLPEKYL